MASIEILLYLGNTLIGDVNKYADNRHLSTILKSEQENADCDVFSFDINWKLFKDMVALRFDDLPSTMLRVGKTRVVFVDGGKPKFGGFLASKPERSGLGAQQTLSLTFYEHYARMSGDLVCDPSDTMSPVRVFTARAGHLYVQDLVGEYLARAAAAGEVLNWDFDHIDTLPNKTITYNDFQPVAKALCDSMNNVTGTGKFDVVFKIDPLDYTHVLIDIRAPRGTVKNIIIKYPGDGVYALWSSGYEVDESNSYASDVLVAGNGQVGDPTTGQNTAALAAANNFDFVEEYCYWREYSTQSNLESQAAVQDYATKLLAQRDFGQEVPKITLVGRDIDWFDSNEDNGLDVGDVFYFSDVNDDSDDTSGYMRIIGIEADYDSNGTATVQPRLLRWTED